MKAESKIEANDRSPAFFTFAYSLVEDILANAGNPSRMNDQLVRQLRELTGARLVVLASNRETGTEGCAHQLSAVEPGRRRAFADSTGMMALADRTCTLDGPTFWEGGDDFLEEISLAEELPGPAVAVPLRVGRRHVGAICFLDCRTDTA